MLQYSMVPSSTGWFLLLALVFFIGTTDSVPATFGSVLAAPFRFQNGAIAPAVLFLSGLNRLRCRQTKERCQEVCSGRHSALRFTSRVGDQKTSHKLMCEAMLIDYCTMLDFIRKKQSLNRKYTSHVIVTVGFQMQQKKVDHKLLEHSLRRLEVRRRNVKNRNPLIIFSTPYCHSRHTVPSL